MTVLSPYLYAWSQGDTRGFRTNSFLDIKKIGLKNIILAFLTEDRYDEIRGWRNEIKEMKGSVEVTLSIGGATGRFPSKHLDVTQESSKLICLMKDLEIRRLDLDIEGKKLSDHKNVNKWVSIIKVIYEYFEGKIWISLTLPAEFTGGFSKDAMNAIELFRQANVRIEIYNCMLMDYYTPLGNFQCWGDKNIDVLRTIHNQLSTRFFNMNNVWSKIGICPMIGMNDDKTIFTLKDWEKLLEFGRQHGIGMVSFWAINRDQCNSNGGKNNIYSHSCSQQVDLQYTNTMINKFK